MDITVDVCIIMDATGLNGEIDKCSSDLLDTIATHPDYMICLDSRSKIKFQYDTKIKRGDGIKWLQHIYSNQKYIIINWKNLPRKVIVKLQEEHFDSATGEDVKYVITANGSSTKKLVTRDPDYSPTIISFLKKELGVVVANPCTFLSQKQ